MDVENLDHLDFAAGLAPNLRGPYSTMYVQTAHGPFVNMPDFQQQKTAMLFTEGILQAGQKGLSVAFDLATHRGYDSDHERVVGDVGKAGVAIDSVSRI